MQSKEYKLPNGKTAVFEYDVYRIGKVTLESMDELMSMIADRPQEWIPCSERLPNEKEIVLITNDKGNVRFGQFRGTHGKYWIWKGNTLETVLAWMPLPKPWKGADDE